MEIKDLKGYQWAREVVSGEFLANKWVKLECQKYIDRLEKLQYQEDFNYYFDLNECHIIYSMLKYINFGSGAYIGKPFRDYLAGFQYMILENIFCWLSKTEGKNDMMIQDVILQISRKNSKSVLSALIEILILLRSPKFSQHAIAGKNKNISALIKKDMERIIKSSPKLQKYFKITNEQILCKSNESFCRNLAGDSSSLDGLLLQSFIVDECANLPNQDLIGVLKLSQMSVSGSRLAIYISTANTLEICAFYDLVDYYKKHTDSYRLISGLVNKYFYLIYLYFYKEE